MAAQPPIRTITPISTGLAEQLRELFLRRELVAHLAIKDIKVRYKQTLIGALWAILQPVMTMVVFTLFFGKLAKVPSDGLPYPIFYFTALLPWTYFSSAVQQGANSVVNNQNMIKKVYFPRLALPVAGVTVGLVDLAIASLILLILMPVYDVDFSLRMFFALGFVALAFLTALAVSLWLSILNAQFRDIQHALPFAIQLWMFLSPVAYGSSLVPEKWRTLYALNPLTSVIEGFRWSITGVGKLDLQSLSISTALVVLVLFAGLAFFRRAETDLADIV